MAYLYFTLTHSKDQGLGHGISRKQRQIGQKIRIFRFHPELEVKVMSISTVNIAKMVTDMANNIITIKYDVACVVSISIFRFDLFPC